MKFRIPDNELIEEYVRPSSGPGGQKQNKTSNAVRLRWNFMNSSLALTESQKIRLIRIARPYLAEDEIILLEKNARSLFMNRQAARTHLNTLLDEAWLEPKKRKPTKATRASVQRRLQSKSERSSVKKLRSRPSDD